MPHKKTLLFVDQTTPDGRKNARVHLVKQAQQRRQGRATESPSQTQNAVEPSALPSVPSCCVREHDRILTKPQNTEYDQSHNVSHDKTDPVIYTINAPFDDRLLSLYLHHPSFSSFWGTHPSISPTPQALNVTMMHAYPIIQQMVLSSVAMHCLKIRLLLDYDRHALLTIALTLRGEAFRSTRKLLGISGEGCDDWEHRFAVVLKVLTLEYRLVIEEGKLWLWRHFEACRRLVQFVSHDVRVLCNATGAQHSPCALLINNTTTTGCVVQDLLATYPFVPAFRNTQLHHLALTFEICNTTTDSLIWTSQHLTHLQQLTMTLLVHLTASNVVDTPATPSILTHNSLLAHCLRSHHQPNLNSNRVVPPNPAHGHPPAASDLYNDISPSHAHLGVVVFLALLTLHCMHDQTATVYINLYLARLETRLETLGMQAAMETMLNLAWLASESEGEGERGSGNEVIVIEKMQWVAAGVVLVAKREAVEFRERIREGCVRYLGI